MKDSKKELMAALLAAQRDCGAIAQDKRGPRGAYASVDAVVAECRGILHRHGLALVELRVELERVGDPGEQGFETLFVHDRGLGLRAAAT